jgi:serine/threonine protein kinase
MPEIGQSLLHYSIVEKIGKGGMGEVYRAKDQKLGRDVAIKVLPEEVAKDADRVARFQREAKLLASLNHPNIAAIHGLEESDGTNFLVMELIEGQTLGDRIKTGPIPVDECLKLALQIAESLEAAHEKGVIHRDLKPANIKVTPDGKVKVLDFGLAKAFAGEQAELNLSNSPTLSDMATMQGVILGTAAYMSPEQARGKSVDKRTDIWAFGCVLYEMLTGKAAFQGEDVTEILAAVVKSGVNLDLLPADIHPRIRELIFRCLQKDPKKRYSGTSDVQYEIGQVLADPSGVFVRPVSAIKPKKRPQVGLPWTAAAVIVASMIVGAAVWKLKPSELRQVMRFDYDLPKDQQFNDLGLNFGFTLAISSDGNKFAYSTNKGIFLRSIDEMDARLIANTDQMSDQPFFSPDGQWIGYASLNTMRLKKAAIRGGAPIDLCEAPLFYGAVWNPDNLIVFAERAGGIKKVSANGGIPETLVAGLGFFPQLLPDGESVLLTDESSSQFKVIVQSLESGERKELFNGSAARYLPTGHIVYKLDNNLTAIPFDLDKLEPSGSPVSLIQDISEFDVSDSGTLVYIPGKAGSAADEAALVWVDKEGKEEPLGAGPARYNLFKISPDGKQVAITVDSSSNQDIWIWDVDRKILTRRTFNEANDAGPLWTPDGQWIVYRTSTGKGEYDINRKKADGTGAVEKIGSSPNNPWAFSWSIDGKVLLLWELVVFPQKPASAFQTDIAAMSMEGDHLVTPLLNRKFNEDHPKISPDGHWLAYSSNESGQNEVYVRPYPDVNKGGQWQISNNGGNSPLWSPNGRQIFYRKDNAVMAVPVETESRFDSGKPDLLFQGEYISNRVGEVVLPMWDMHPDGKRFLMTKPAQATGDKPESAIPRKINIVVNWFEELKERVPVE